tara:strand:+ start:402 stop:872 length:471 start_codon:yes stop_codon:yes gene_type:complete
MVSKGLVLLFLFVNFVHADDIQLSPLINLDQIEPSYEVLDEQTVESEVEPDLTENDSSMKERKINTASISVLNKITANVEKLDIRLKKNYKYGELRIYPIDCYISSPDEKSETAIYLNVYHVSKDEKIFSGWMLKTLPSISAIEHPIYDIWVNECY